MVVEHSYVLSLDEIKAIRFRCPKCQASTSFQLDESITFPTVCPGCRATLYDKTLDIGHGGTIHALPRTIKGLLKLQEREKSFEMLLEIDAPRNPR